MVYFLADLFMIDDRSIFFNYINLKIERKKYKRINILTIFYNIK